MKSESYQPCNGTEMDCFSSRFCFKCIKMPISNEAGNQCVILRDVLFFDVGDKEYPNQWQRIDGKPQCTAFVDRDKANAKRRANPKPKTCRDKKTLSLL